MKTTHLFIILFFTWSVRGGAQSAGTDTVYMSLKQCVAYAIENQNAVKNAALESEISHRKTQEITGIAFPQISARFDFLDYLTLPTSLIPAEFFGGEPGDYVPIQFGTQYNGTLSLEASQLVFDGRYFLGLKATRALADIASKNVERTQIDAIESVQKAYLAAVITAERVKQLEVNIASLKTTLDNTLAMYRAGFVEKVDADRIQVGYNNLLAEQDKAVQYKTLSMYMLKFQMGMDVNQPLVLTDTLREADFEDILQAAAAPDINKRVEYQMLLTQKSLREMNIKQYQVGYLPTLYALSAYSYQAQVNEFDLIASSEWYNTFFIGFSLNLPIFDGLQKARSVQQARLSLAQTENNLLEFRNAMNLQVSSAKTNMQNAIATLEVQKSNLELADEVVRISRKKFEVGVGSSLEVTDAETGLKDAQVNYLNALYDAWIAKVDLDKALGILAAP